MDGPVSATVHHEYSLTHRHTLKTRWFLKPLSWDGHIVKGALYTTRFVSLIWAPAFALRHTSNAPSYSSRTPVDTHTRKSRTRVDDSASAVRRIWRPWRRTPRWLWRWPAWCWCIFPATLWHPCFPTARPAAAAVAVTLTCPFASDRPPALPADRQNYITQS